MLLLCGSSTDSGFPFLKRK
ncbi:hypothetical protein F383_30360 [Gossypium arboreum]|uniref:Uncharacterized protein n=1 Tax=Gossypium arboreum TaxID=29729 RepID=A0A0B0MW68_GOSAR|nr:hypothetical protein F383_30360 [Gossypium arboreum]